MHNASEKNPSHPSAVLVREANKWHDQFRAHRLENLRKQAKELLESFRRGDPPAVERFSAHHPNFPKDRFCLADAQSVIAREQGFASWPKMKSSLGRLLLSDEVERIHRKLQADGKGHFAAMITEESLRRAILKGIESYEALPDYQVNQPDGRVGYFEATVKPILLEVVETGVWTDKGMVDVFYETTDEHGVAYEGLGACLEMRTPGAGSPGFCLSILDVWYGRF
jgi:hypothetical protein